MIDGWKKKYGDVFEITVEDKKCYLHKPGRAHISAAATLSKGDNIKNSEILLNNCWLGVDEEIKTDDSYFFGALSTLSELIIVRTAELKNFSPCSGGRTAGRDRADQRSTQVLRFERRPGLAH